MHTNIYYNQRETYFYHFYVKAPSKNMSCWHFVDIKTTFCVVFISAVRSEILHSDVHFRRPVCLKWFPSDRTEGTTTPPDPNYYIIYYNITGVSTKIYRYIYIYIFMRIGTLYNIKRKRAIKVYDEVLLFFFLHFNLASFRKDDVCVCACAVYSLLRMRVYRVWLSTRRFILSAATLTAWINNAKYKFGKMTRVVVYPYWNGWKVV